MMTILNWVVFVNKNTPKQAMSSMEEKSSSVEKFFFDDEREK